MTIPWTRKYQPKSGKEVVGQQDAVENTRNFLENFKKQGKKAMILYGPSGCGKTSIVYALAHELNLELLEINASDVRNQEQINKKIGSAISQYSLFGKGKVILVDELDGISGRKDRGGASALAKLISKTIFPIIMTANDPFAQKFNPLRKVSFLVSLESLGVNELAVYLKEICKKENIKCEDDALKRLARSTGGDLRAAINDLQTLSTDGQFTSKELEFLGERNKVESVLSALVRIFKTTDANIAVRAFDNVQEDLDKCFLWVDENLPKEYTKSEDLARAYDCLSRADVFRGRIRRWQHWRFLVYVNTLLTAGVAVAKDEKYKHVVQYKPTTRILKLWKANMMYQRRKAIAQKLAPMLHTSAKRVVKDYIPYLKFIFQKNRSMANSITEQFELEKEEIDWLKK